MTAMAARTAVGIMNVRIQSRFQSESVARSTRRHQRRGRGFHQLVSFCRREVIVRLTVLPLTRRLRSGPTACYTAKGRSHAVAGASITSTLVTMTPLRSSLPIVKPDAI